MKNPQSSFADKRRIINIHNGKYEPYEFGGPAIDGITQLDLTYDHSTGHGAYVIRMEPGTETTAHVHTLREEYLIIEGDVVESDGTVLGPGDYVIYEPGTEHNSRTVGGCLLIGMDYPAPS